MVGMPTCGCRLGRHGATLSLPNGAEFHYVAFFNAEVMIELAAMLEFERERLSTQSSEKEVTYGDDLPLILEPLLFICRL